MSLEIKGFLVVNPTDDWYSYALKDGSTKYRTSIIPPRSGRRFPSMANPQIIQPVKLTKPQIDKLLSQFISSAPVIVEPIDIEMQGIMEGTIKSKAGEETPLSSVVDISHSKIFGWFSYNETLYVYQGNINSKTHFIQTTVYLSNSTSFQANGKIEKEDSVYSIQLSSVDLTINLSMDINDSEEIEQDTAISGKYLAFYIFDSNQYELSLNLQVSGYGLITGNGKEESNFEVFGCSDLGNSKFFLVRPINSELIFYSGTIEGGENEVFISGDCKRASKQGTFTFIKNMM